MAVRFGLIDSVTRRKAGRKSYFSPKGKVALMFLKSHTGLSAPKLMEQLNANIHYQIFCGIRISPANPLTNYKLIDDIFLELSKCLKIQTQQKGTLRSQADKRPNQEDRNPNHLLRYPHGKCSTNGKENCESGTPSGCITTYSIILHTRDNYALTKQKSVQLR